MIKVVGRPRGAKAVRSGWQLRCTQKGIFSKERRLGVAGHSRWSKGWQGRQQAGPEGNERSRVVRNVVAVLVSLAVCRRRLVVGVVVAAAAAVVVVVVVGVVVVVVVTVAVVVVVR